MDSGSEDMEYGDFEVVWTDEPYLTNFLRTDDDDNLLGSIDLLCSTPSDTTVSQTLDSIASQPALTDLPPPETPSIPQPSRFKNVDKSTIEYFEGLTQAKSTKRNTLWGIKILQEWHTEVYGERLDFSKGTPEELSEKLRKFYCEVRTKKGELYHKNTLKNMRAAINRYFQDNNIEVDIVNDTKFKSCNRVLNGYMKNMTHTGVARPTKHYQQITVVDLQKINEYFKRNVSISPIALRHCVWYILSFQFVSRGLEFHNQLSINSLDFNVDDNGLEYVTLTHQTQEKNFQGGLYSDDFHRDKRMYATGGDLCPVKMLKLLISRTSPDSQSLFNSMTNDALKSPQLCNIWYKNSPIQKRSFSGFMPDISSNAHCSQKYTAHCLRATAITGMSDAGFEARHIMYMSGHRNEGSLRSYNRNPSQLQKKDLSHTLTAVATGECHRDLVIASRTPCTSTITHSPNTVSSVNHTNSTSPSAGQSVVMSNTSSSSGLLNNSTFSGCTFNIVMKN